MKTEQVLQQLGLDEKEAKVYLAGLRLGHETAYNIAKEAKMKRPTVYYTLEKLKEGGLASTRQTQKAMYYSMVSPKRLLKIWENKKALLEKALPDLKEIESQQKHRPSVQVLEGINGVMSVYKEAVAFLKKHKEVLYFGSIDHYEREDYKKALEMWTSAVKNRGYHVREILPGNNPVFNNYLKQLNKKPDSNHQIRTLPKGIEFNQNDNLIYGNKLAIFSVQKETFVIVIESRNIVDSYRAFFEVAWMAARSVKQ